MLSSLCSPDTASPPSPHARVEGRFAEMLPSDQSLPKPGARHLQRSFLTRNGIANGLSTHELKGSQVPGTLPTDRLQRGSPSPKAKAQNTAEGLSLWQRRAEGKNECGRIEPSWGATQGRKRREEETGNKEQQKLSRDGQTPGLPHRPGSGRSSEAVPLHRTQMFREHNLYPLPKRGYRRRDASKNIIAHFPCKVNAF